MSLKVLKCAWSGCDSEDVEYSDGETTCMAYFKVDENQQNATCFCNSCKRYFGIDFKFSLLSDQEMDQLAKAAVPGHPFGERT
jgi:hypothetical protein